MQKRACEFANRSHTYVHTRAHKHTDVGARTHPHRYSAPCTAPRNWNATRTVYIAN